MWSNISRGERERERKDCIFLVNVSILSIFSIITWLKGKLTKLWAVVYPLWKLMDIFKKEQPMIFLSLAICLRGRKTLSKLFAKTPEIVSPFYNLITFLTKDTCFHCLTKHVVIRRSLYISMTHNFVFHTLAFYMQAEFHHHYLSNHNYNCRVFRKCISLAFWNQN